MSSLVRLSRPNISESDIQAVTETLKSGNLVHGEKGLRFEEALTAFLHAIPALVVSSGTAALHLAALAAKLGPGDIVLVPAFSFPATANAMALTGATVRFVDVEPDTYCVSAESIAAAVSRLTDRERVRIKAIVPVHEFGYPAPMENILTMARGNGWIVIEDAACALGAHAGSDPAGTLGDMGCFSFHPRKTLTTGEGGAFVSRHADLIERVKLLRNHGIRRDPQQVDFVEPGLNYRLTDMQSALGLSQLERLPEWLDRRKELAASYIEKLSDCPEIRLPRWSEGHSWQTFMIRLDARINQQALIRSMLNKGFEVNLGAQAIPLMSAYRQGDVAANFPVACDLYRQGLALPFCESYDTALLAEVVKALKACLKNPT